MNLLTDSERMDLNRRVSVLLGAIVTYHKPIWSPAEGWKLRQLSKPIPGAERVPSPCWEEHGLYGSEEYAWSQVHDFCRDPRAAALIMEEIERGGWVWSLGPHMDANDGGEKYFSVVSGGSYRCSKSPYGMAGAILWTEALARAFVSAKELEEGAQNGSEKHYRRLKKGEIVLETDEYYDDAKKAWVSPTGSVGGGAPDPAYTAHRQFRRAIPTEGFGETR